MPETIIYLVGVVLSGPCVYECSDIISAYPGNDLAACQREAEDLREGVGDGVLIYCEFEEIEA